MKYVQPLGISDPNASYIDGNPATGTKGSAVPAAMCENPQREIVNLIADAAFTPAGTDLHQLGKGVQSGKLTYSLDTGTTATVIVTLTPIPDAYYTGMTLRFKAAHAPLGPMTLDAGRGAAPIVKTGGNPLVGGEWTPGDIVVVAYDGAHWQLPNSPLAILYANKDYYVSPTGLDTNNGLTSGTPFLTLQKAWNTAQLYNLNGFNVNIHVADGTYSQGVAGRQINGSGAIIFIGNIANPQNVLVQSAAGPAFTIGGAALVYINGFRLSSLSRPPGTPSCDIWAAGGGLVIAQAVDFGSSLDAQIFSGPGGSVQINGPIRIVGSATSHMSADSSGYIQAGYPAPTLQILNAVSFSTGFVVASDCGSIVMNYASIAGAAFVTGPRYYAAMNGTINSGGGGVNYFPGTAAGTTSNGGQYV